MSGWHPSIRAKAQKGAPDKKKTERAIERFLNAQPQRDKVLSETYRRVKETLLFGHTEIPL